MHIIEPCCAKKNLLALRDAIGNNGTTLFEGYGDLSLTELLPALLTRYSETEMMLVAPSVPDQAQDVIKKWMKKQWARRDGKGRLNVIGRLTVIADLSEEASPAASEWLKENPFGERLTLVSRQQTDTAILLPDMAIVGPVNMKYDKPFIATVTTRMKHVEDIWEHFRRLSAESPSSSES